MEQLNPKLVVEVECAACGGTGLHRNPGSRETVCTGCNGSRRSTVIGEQYCAQRGEHGPWVTEVTVTPDDDLEYSEVTKKREHTGKFLHRITCSYVSFVEPKDVRCQWCGIAASEVRI